MKTANEKRLHTARLNLLVWQPGATHVELVPRACPHCHSSRYVSYVYPDLGRSPPLDETLEYCGYYCTACLRGNAGARKINRCQ